jgi:hypothetical protein
MLSSHFRNAIHPTHPHNKRPLGLQASGYPPVSCQDSSQNDPINSHFLLCSDPPGTHCHLCPRGLLFLSRWGLFHAAAQIVRPELAARTLPYPSAGMGILCLCPLLRESSVTNVCPSVWGTLAAQSSTGHLPRSHALLLTLILLAAHCLAGGAATTLCPFAFVLWDNQ